MKEDIVKLLTVYLENRDSLSEDEKRIILRSLEMVNICLEKGDR